MRQPWPLWAMVLAAFILKEPITGMKIGGIASGAAGALLLICGNTSSNEVFAPNPLAIWGGFACPCRTIELCALHCSI